MTAGGIAFMAISWAVIIGFNAACLRRLLAVRAGTRADCPNTSDPTSRREPR